MSEARAVLAAVDGRLNLRAHRRGQIRRTEPDRLAPLYHLLIVLGFRRGEVLGLMWRSIDWEAGTITIEQQVQAINGVTTISRQVKTENSRRKVPAPRPILDLLRVHRVRQAEERRLLGPEWKEHGLVFASERGTPLSPNNLWRRWRIICALAGIEPPRIHDLRHTAASLLSKTGASRDVISAILGHSPDTTTGLYVHVDLDQMRAALDRLCAELYATSRDDSAGDVAEA